MPLIFVASLRRCCDIPSAVASSTSHQLAPLPFSLPLSSSSPGDLRRRRELSQPPSRAQPTTGVRFLPSSRAPCSATTTLPCHSCPSLRPSALAAQDACLLLAERWCELGGRAAGELPRQPASSAGDSHEQIFSDMHGGKEEDDEWGPLVGERGRELSGLVVNDLWGPFAGIFKSH